MRAIRASYMIGPERDLARRGWLAAAVVRRDYGRSDDALLVPLTCRGTSFDRRFSSEADDLQAALDFLTPAPGRRSDTPAARQ